MKNAKTTRRILAIAIGSLAAVSVAQAQFEANGNTINYGTSQFDAYGNPIPVSQQQFTATPEQTENEAWKEALRDLVPLSPGQIRDLRQMEEEVQRASRPREAPEMATSEAVQVSMEPGGRSPVITLLHGFVSAIEVLDATGQPWPVVEARQGDAAALEVQVVGVGNETAQNNIITVTPGEKFSATNLILVLQNASRPISMILRAEEAKANMELRDRVTLIVGGQGPNARVEASGFSHLDADEALRNALVGRPPSSGAQEIVKGLPSGMRAWRDGDVLWVRTRDTLIRPAPKASVAMGDVRAYKMDYLPVIVTSQNGSLQTVHMTNTR
jgi:hypothetical protein